MTEFQYFIINDEGASEEIDSFEKNSENVYIIVEHESRRIFLWKGSKAGIQLKFIGAREMTEKRKQFGFHYKTYTEDEGDEGKDFISTFDGTATTVSEPKPLHVESEAPPDLEAMARAQGIDVDHLDDEEDLSGTPVAGMGAVGNRPQPTLLSMMSDDGEIEEKKAKKKAKKKAVATYREDVLDEAKGILKELKDTPGFQREMVVIGDRLFRVSSNNYDLEEFDSALEGIFNVNEYVPRLICSSGRVILMELMKKTGEEMSDELSQNLSDLTSMFMIEIDD